MWLYGCFWIPQAHTSNHKYYYLYLLGILKWTTAKFKSSPLSLTQLRTICSSCDNPFLSMNILDKIFFLPTSLLWFISLWSLGISSSWILIIKNITTTNYTNDWIFTKTEIRTGFMIITLMSAIKSHVLYTLALVTG